MLLPMYRHEAAFSRLSLSASYHRSPVPQRFAGCDDYPEDGVVERTAQLVEVKREVIEAAVEERLAAGAVVREEHEDQRWLFLAGLHGAEVGLTESVRRLFTGEDHPLPAIDVEAAIGWVEGRLGLELAPEQREAIRRACREKVLVITGGPGVGKTTLVRSILDIFEAKKLRCVLAAPTGRAAKRLSEATGRSACTIHRLLAFDPSSGNFKKNYQDPLEGGVFVLDEVSMVDVVLGHQFLRAVPRGACVILVGDVDQLPSVGPGTVLADLIDSGAVPVVRLAHIFRQAQASRIVQAAWAVHEGKMPPLQSSQAELTDFYFAEAQEPEAIERLVVKLVRERIPERFGLDPQTDIQVLTPMNRSLLGSRNLNRVLQEALNPPRGQSEVERFGWTFRVDRRTGAGAGRLVRGSAGGLRLRLARRAVPGVRADGPQEPGQ